LVCFALFISVSAIVPVQSTSSNWIRTEARGSVSACVFPTEYSLRFPASGASPHHRSTGQATERYEHFLKIRCYRQLALIEL
jgi:hypothetical protein